MTEIPGTTTLKTKVEADLNKSINVESIIDIKKIKQHKAKNSDLNFDNLDFKNWVIISSLLVTSFVIYLCFTSIKFILLIFSGPGIGVVSFYFKEQIRKRFLDNDFFIRRYFRI